MEPLPCKLVSDLWDFRWALQPYSRCCRVTQTGLEHAEFPVQMHPESFGRLAAGVQYQDSRASVRVPDEERLRLALIAKNGSGELGAVGEEMIQCSFVMGISLECRRNVD